MARFSSWRLRRRQRLSTWILFDVALSELSMMAWSGVDASLAPAAHQGLNQAHGSGPRWVFAIARDVSARDATKWNCRLPQDLDSGCRFRRRRRTATRVEARAARTCMPRAGPRKRQKQRTGKTSDSGASDITACMEGRNKELPGIAEEVLKSTKREVEEKGLRQSITEGEK